MNKLYLGDNLDILRKIQNESVDLICTDPPFNSGPDNKDYFRVASAKNEEVKNIWTWDKTAEDARVEIEKRSTSCKLYKALNKCPKWIRYVAKQCCDWQQRRIANISYFYGTETCRNVPNTHSNREYVSAL